MTRYIENNHISYRIITSK